MALQTAAAILAIDDIVTKEVAVPEWNDTVFVKGMTGIERDEFEAQNRDNKTGRTTLRNIRARFLVRCIVNENGTRIFGDRDAADLGKKSSAAIDRLWEAASALSGTSDEEEDEIEGNSEEGTETADGSDSPSTSPETSDAPAPSYSPASAPTN